MTKTFRDLQESLGQAAPFFLYGGVCLPFSLVIFWFGQVCLFGLLFIFIFLPETRGKTPEETAQSFVGLQPLLDRVGHFPLLFFGHLLLIFQIIWLIVVRLQPLLDWVCSHLTLLFFGYLLRIFHIICLIVVGLQPLLDRVCSHSPIFLVVDSNKSSLPYDAELFQALLSLSRLFAAHMNALSKFFVVAKMVKHFTEDCQEDIETRPLSLDILVFFVIFHS